MRYLDLFDRPTEAWVRGEAVLGRKTGKVTLEASPQFNQATLSGGVVNPRNLSEFHATLVWGSPDDSPRAIRVCLGKRHEWTPPSEAPFRICIDADRSVTVTGTDGKPSRLATAVRQENGERRISFGKHSGSLIVSVGGEDLALPWSDEDGGYLTLQSCGAAVLLRRFELESPHDFAPLTGYEREADTRAWLGYRADRNWADAEVIEKHIDSCAEAGAWGFGCDLSVSPGMVRPGERVEIVCRVSGEVAPGGEVRIEPDYLSAEAGAARDVPLNWRREGPGWVAESVIIPDRPGNWRVSWQTAEERLTRVVAVVGDAYAVCTLWVGSNVPDIDSELHQYDLPGDYWIGDWWSPFGRPAEGILDYIRPYARMRHRYGDRLVPFVNAGFIVPGTMNYNLSDIDEGIQAEGLGLVQRLWGALGIGPLEIVASYTLGHDTARILKRLGVKAISSLCTWQNWIDGHSESGWKINHMGAPNAPYFVADADFRKVARGKSIVASSMGTATSVRQYCILTMEAAPSLTCPLQRYTDNTAQSANMTRFYDAVEGWLKDTEYQYEPVFFTVGMEDFGGRPDWHKANALAVDYLVEQAKTRKLVFASLADIADFYQAHHEKQPENVLYQPDTYCGYRCENKPAQISDRIEVSNDEFHTLHVDGQALPQFFWDFTQTWDEPEWNTYHELRDSFGLITPERLRWDTTVPRQVNRDGVSAEVTITPEDGGVEVRIDIDSPRAMSCLPVGVWRVPLDSEGVAVVECSSATRWIGVVDWATANVHGIAVCADLPQGRSTRTLRLLGECREPRSAEASLFGRLRSRTVRRDGTDYTYLWRGDGVPAVSIEVRVPEGRDVEVRYNDGEVVHPDRRGMVTIELSECWQREVPLVVGLTGEEMELAGATRHRGAEPG